MTDTIYDYPAYYDILFSWDRSAEARFYDRILDRAGVHEDEPILEVACGTGRIAIQLARVGRSVVGLDIERNMLTFLESQAQTVGVTVRTICADMTTFSDDALYGAAINPLSSFRLLHSDAEAESHLSAVARSLRSGGAYVLDLEFRDRVEDPPVTTDDEWEMTRDGVTVKATDEVIHVDDHGRELELKWGTQDHLRNYTCATFADRVAAVPSLVIESWHPEAGREGEDGVSVFDADKPLDSCAGGRAMVVLRKI